MPKRILFVDDEDWSVTPYFDKLRDHGLEVDLALNGDEAIERLRSHRYDLIVLDIMLPSGSQIGSNVEPRKAGAILLDKIRTNQLTDIKTSPDVPVVVLTAVTDQEESENIRKLGVNEVFEKPALFEEVTDKILALVNGEKGRKK